MSDAARKLFGLAVLLAGLIVYALLDAYVDAHFRGFDVEFDTDPALPADAAAAPRLRAGLRWTF